MTDEQKKAFDRYWKLCSLYDIYENGKLIKKAPSCEEALAELEKEDKWTKKS